MTRWKFDPKSPANTRYMPHTTMPTSGEFARIDERFVTKPYKHFFLCVVDPTKPYDFAKCGPPVGGLFNCYGHYNWETGESKHWFAGPTSTVQEPVFIPRSKDAEEGDGYLLGLINRLDELRNDLVVLDVKNGIDKGPVAVIRLPLKLKIGLHGNFVPYEDIEEWRRRTGDNKKYEFRKAPKPLRAEELKAATESGAIIGAGR
jgi:carotenoid cleavage dioxygenase-like enzyme